MKKIKAAVIGVGSMGQHHARIYSQLKDVQLVAVCDIDKKRADEVAAKYNTRVFSDYKEMLKSLPRLDVVSIAVPTKFHQEVTCFFLKNKINVLLEKPIADSLEKARQIIKIAKANRVKLTVGHTERFNPVVIKLKEMIEKEELGKILSIIARRVGVFPPNVKDTNVFLDLAVHDIDIINFLLNQVPIKIYKHSSKFHTKTNEDAGEIFLLYNDTAAFIQVNWITPVKIRSLAVTGTKGYAELDYISQKLIMHQAKVEKKIDEFSEFVRFSNPKITPVKIKKEEPLRAEIKSFIECIKNNTQPLVTGQEALNALKISLKE